MNNLSKLTHYQGAFALFCTLSLAGTAAAQDPLSSLTAGAPTKPWWSPYTEADATQIVVLLASVVAGYALGFAVFRALLPNQSPSSSGRFGLLGGAFGFLIYHVIVANFYLHASIPVPVYAGAGLGMVVATIATFLAGRN